MTSRHQIKSKYIVQLWPPFENLEYTCVIEKKTIPESCRNVAFVGQHTKSRSNLNVAKIHFHQCVVKTIPAGLTEIFPRLRSLKFSKCHLGSISRSDLKNLSRLRDLRVEDDTIEYLPGDLLMNLGELTALSFKNNRIRHIEPALLAEFDRLQYLNLSGNTNISCCFKREILEQCQRNEVRRHFEHQTSRDSEDIDSMEEIWTAEVEGLKAQLKRLQDDNRKLLDTQGQLLRSTSKSPEHSLESLAGTLYAEEYRLNERLKEQIKLLEKEVEVKALEICDLNAEVEELKMAQNQLRRQSRAMETQVKTLYEEREEILAEMNNQDKSFVVLRDHLGIAQLENEDLAWRKCNDSERPRFTLKEMSKIVSEKSALEEKAKRLENEIEMMRKREKEEDEFEKFVQKCVSSANRSSFSLFWKRLVMESMSVGPLYNTPI